MRIVQPSFRWVLGLTVAALGCLVAKPALAKDARKPNIVVIVADDLGYNEVMVPGASPKQEIPTPRTTSIATGGVSFSNGYVSCPVCSPTRAGLITGRYQQRFGHEFNPGPAEAADTNFGLPLDQVTLADRLKKLGYATGMVGKWHLGYEPRFQPTRRGFDEFYGFLGGAHSYVDSGADPANRIRRGEEPIDEKEYLTDALGRESVAFIDRHKAAPFFLYLTFNAVHAPMQAPDKYQQRVAHIGDLRRRTFAAMLTAMDDNIGRVLDKLSQEKLDEDTLIFFIADNGGPTNSTTSRNHPLRGFKAQTLEGGIRVPYSIRWTGHLPVGKIYDSPAIALDIVPTAVAAAGGTLADGPPVDGVDLMPYLTGAKSGRPHEMLYWRFGPQWAIRKGDLKLVQTQQGTPQLFDLSKDIGEAHDLTSEQPEIVKQLTKDYQAWNAELKEPLWKPRAQRAAAKANPNRKAGKGKARARAAAQQQL